MGTLKPLKSSKEPKRTFKQRFKDFFKPQPIEEGIRTRDFIRETPGTVKNLGKEIGQGLAREADFVGRTILGKRGRKFFDQEDLDRPSTKAEDILLGGRERRTKAGDIAGLGAEELGINREKHPILAGVGGGAILGLDVIPGGAGAKSSLKNLIKTLSKTTSKKQVVNILKGAKYADDVIDDIADMVAITKDPKVIEELLKPQVKAPVVKAVEPIAEETKSKFLSHDPITEDVGGLGSKTYEQVKSGDLIPVKDTPVKEVIKDDFTVRATEKAKEVTTKQLPEKVVSDVTKTKAVENVYKKSGKSEDIVKGLREKGLHNTEIDKIVLEDGSKITDVVNVKRGVDGEVKTILKKDTLDETLKNYTPRERTKVGEETARLYALPVVKFDRMGLRPMFDDVVRAGRDAEQSKVNYLDLFRQAKLRKNKGIFQKSTLNKKSSRKIALYNLSRSGVDRGVKFTDLSPKEQEWVTIFDSITKDLKPSIFKTAKASGIDIKEVGDFAPRFVDMKKVDIEDMKFEDYMVKTIPNFQSVKSRIKDVPVEKYDLDNYIQRAEDWIGKATRFTNMGDQLPATRNLIKNEQFVDKVNPDDLKYIEKWLKDIETPRELSKIEKGLRAGRKATAISTLGGSLFSAVKQPLTLIATTIMEKSLPKFRSKFAKEQGIEVSKLPALTSRAGASAVSDMTSSLSKYAIGLLTETDRASAWLALNGLIDTKAKKYVKKGVPVTKEVGEKILKEAQDELDMWFGSMTKEQLPEVFRDETGKLLNMFIQPLTSQLNGFVFEVAKVKGIKKPQKVAEALTAMIMIAYSEQVITNMSFNWDEPEDAIKDVATSFAGNVPILSQVIYAIKTDSPLSISPLANSLSRVITNLDVETEEDMKDLGFAIAEVFGTPKVIRKAVEGIEISKDDGFRNKNDKLLAPVEGFDKVRAFLRGKYGSLAVQDYLENNKDAKDRSWNFPEVEFLQNGDYDRKAEIYDEELSPSSQRELYGELSEGQRKLLESAFDRRDAKKRRRKTSTSTGQLKPLTSFK